MLPFSTPLDRFLTVTVLPAALEIFRPVVCADIPASKAGSIRPLLLTVTPVPVRLTTGVPCIIGVMVAPLTTLKVRLEFAAD
ncbi:hypothetical protein ACKI1H_18310 [Pseudomonas sp. YH-1]|uniref:hypothetical protein n=1 Tax=Pseudomonas sp. YH-1 TaxID=3384787 RepID=UPI003F81DDE8